MQPPRPAFAAADSERPPSAARWSASDPNAGVSPDLVLALRYTVSLIGIGLSVASIVFASFVDGHPPGERHDETFYLLGANAKFTGLTARLMLMPRGALASNTATSILEETAFAIQFAAVGATLGELTPRHRDVWFGAFTGLVGVNLYRAPLVWFDRANSSASLWTSAAWTYATTAGGVALALTEPDEASRTALWVLSGLSLATAAHQTVWAILDPAAPRVIQGPRLSWGVGGLGSGFGASLAGRW